MDMKTNSLGSKLNTLLSKGATIAKEGLDYVGKQITDIKTNINSGPNSISDDRIVPSESSHLAAYTNEDVSIGDSQSRQIPVFYCYQPSSCPTQCTFCNPVVKIYPSTSLSKKQCNRKESTEDTCDAADCGTHVFFLPQSTQSIENITVKQLKGMLPGSITSKLLLGDYQSIHLRFKSTPPVEDQDIFLDYVWLDVDENMTPPTYRGFIHFRILPLSVTCKSHNDHQSRVNQMNKYHQRCTSNNDSLPAKQVSNSRLDYPGYLTPTDKLTKKIDLLGPYVNNLHRFEVSPSSSNSSPSLPSNSQNTTFASPPSNPSSLYRDPESDRAEIAFKRGATKEARIQEVMNEHAARRQKELAEEEEKFSASEELREELDHWALTRDGTYKDLRALLSSLTDVRP